MERTVDQAFGFSWLSSVVFIPDSPSCQQCKSDDTLRMYDVKGPREDWTFCLPCHGVVKG